MPRLADQLDGEHKGGGVHRQRDQIGWLGVDEVVGADALVDQCRGADTALQLTDHVGEDDIAPEPNAGLDQRAQRAEVGGVSGLHVGDADTVNEGVVDLPRPGVDGPALSDRIGIEMAVEQKTFAASCATSPPDRVDAAARNRGQRRVKAKRLNLAHHETGQLAFALGLRIAFARTIWARKSRQARASMRASSASGLIRRSAGLA